MTRVLSKFSQNPINALITLITWILLVVVINIISPSLSDVTSNEQEEFLPADVESVKAINLQLDKYPTNSGLSAIVVFHAAENFFSTDGNIDIDNINQLKNFVYFFQENQEKIFSLTLLALMGFIFPSIMGKNCVRLLNAKTQNFPLTQQLSRRSQRLRICFF